ncbi:MAG: hypothetical protein P9L94_09140 [Candidatus Hinthialibacter antarcticus]|nr:hypothetical protein [Candidatus Hinthialibacter antarcticus]
MKVHPLFHPISEPSADDMLLMLDLPDEAPQKRAFLDQCSQSERLQLEWQDLNALMAAGKALPQREPRLSIRDNVLLAARTNRTVTPMPTLDAANNWSFNGWRWAWAAIFLVVMWGGSAEFQRKADLSWTTETTWETETIEEELLTLDEEMAELFSDFETDFESAFSGLTS